jgi:hypothetical protein
VRGLVVTVLVIVVRDVTEQPGKDAAMNGPKWRSAEGCVFVVDRLQSVKRGREFEIVALAQDVQQLCMHVAPLAQSRVAQKVIPTETSEFCLAEFLNFVVVGVPNVEDRQEI